MKPRGLVSSWAFESRGDGTIHFYPHRWGRAYVVPTEEKHREIEKFLALWLMKLRLAARVALWVSLPVIAVLLAAVTPPFCRFAWYTPYWPTIVQSAERLYMGCLLVVVGSPLALRFLAEVAKADLEKANARRPFAEWLAAHAQQSDWRGLWFGEIIFCLVLLAGLWLLWPRRDSLMLPAHSDPHVLVAGLVLAAIGGAMARPVGGGGGQPLANQNQKAVGAPLVVGVAPA